MRGRRRLVPLLVAALLVAIVFSLPITLTPEVRARLTDALSERFDGDVEIGTLRVSMLPYLQVRGERVVLRHEGRTDVPPLITIASFSARATLWGLLGRPLRLKGVHLEGLEINIPPGGTSNGDRRNDERKKNKSSRRPPPAAKGEPPSAPDSTRPDANGRSSRRSPLIVDDLLSERAVLRILRSDPDKRARVFEITRLSMQGAGSNDPWPFKATLTNPTPPGEIATEGTFGPWNADRPASTALDAKYEFRNADLGVFKGIRGTLHSTGAFAGVLERIDVNGRTEVGNFALEDVGHPVPLTAAFHAIVDGTNGNTWLRPVDARLRRSPILANGGVVERDGDDGRTVALDVVMTDARIADVLRLVVKSANAPMTGALNLKTSLVLPPGNAAAIERLRLDGTFEIARARFTAGTVQARLNELSQKAQGNGEPGEPPERVVSGFTGRFIMDGGVIRFSKVTFAVPGAKVDLAGRYAIRSEALDLRGTVQLDAKLSELTTGAKSLLLKLADPLVRRNDVTVIPVTVRGTARKPDFGLDIARAFARK